jgi:hypothetical protein
MMLAAVAVLLMSQMQHAPLHGAPASPPPASAVAAPLSDEEVRSRVNAYLGAIDTAVPESVWKGLGPRAAGVLLEIFADKNEPSYRRARALGVLSVVAPQQAAKVAPGAAADEQEAYLVRLTAVKAAQRSLADAPFHGAMTELLRNAQDPRVRSRAALSLAERGGDCAAVRAQVGREYGDDREYFHAALKECSKPQP